MWARASNYVEVVQKSWVQGFDGPINIQSVWSNLGKMLGSVQQWSFKTFGLVRKEIKKLEKRLVTLRSSGTTSVYSEEERSIERKLCELFE
jgi:hypothetical protein